MTETNIPRNMAYDPKKLKIYLDGERLSGFPWQPGKAKVNRGLNGKAEVIIYLSGVSKWVAYLRQHLGDKMLVYVAYEGDFYSENLNFRSSLILVGFEVLYDGEVPVFAFKFKEE